jgi:glycosyltransferase involved in cell wall biosynthesis
MEETAGCYRVLHIFGTMNRGGAEMRTLELMGQLDPRRYQFDFCSLTGLVGDLDDEIRRLGGKVHHVKLSWMFPWRFTRLLRRERYEAVHSHVHFFSGYLLRLAARAGVRRRIAHFWTTGAAGQPGLRRRWQTRLMKHWLDRYATDLLAVSEGAMDASWGPDRRGDSRCRVVYDALDPRRFAVTESRELLREQEGIPPGAPVYIHVGNMLPPKNHVRLVSIFAAIHRIEPQARLLLVGRGGGDIEERVVESARQAGIGEYVVRLGIRPDVPRLLRLADAMVFPSLWEGLPGVVLEAAAVGTPVLAADLPGVREVARHVPGVRILPLAAGDQEWACAATELARTQREAPAQEPNEFRLRGTPFVIERAMEHYREVYA